MKTIKLTKETIALIFITILSAVFNLGNLSIEGTANAYYAAAVKSMTMSFKNFFFAAFDPTGFISIDKPPMGFWLQAISAKIFGFSGWSIILPQALAGVISVVVIYNIVKRSFGKGAGLISALCLAVTPVFVAASRNNTIDNVLVLFLLLACWALSIAAEKGKFKYLVLSMLLVGLGFNVKMLQAYMVIPALYITYLLATAVSLKKRIVHLAAAALVLSAVSLSWALVVDSTPASSRPYVDSSSNNTVMELIFGHNGAERLSLSSKGKGGPGGNGQAMPQPGSNSNSSSSQNGSGQRVQVDTSSKNGQNLNENTQRGSEGNIQGGPGGMPYGSGNMQGGPGGGPGGGPSGLQGSTGNELASSITRLFAKNILSDQIVWFLILAVFGFTASAINEKLSFKLNNKRQQSIVLWFMWFLPVFIFFSFNTGIFHPYYLTMLAPPAAALTGIGIVSMWELYIKGGWKSWFLPVALTANGAVQLLMLTYFIDTSIKVKILMVLLIILCFGASLMLSILNFLKKSENNSEKNAIHFKKVLVSLAMTGLLVTPFTGSAAAMFTGVGSSFPQAGLELLSDNQAQNTMGRWMPGSSNSGLTDYLLKNKTSSQKYLLVVSTSNEGADIIIKTGQPVLSIGGFGGTAKSITLDKFIELVKKGEVRYVMTGGNRPGGNGGPGNESKSAVTEIMNWVKENGKAVSASEYSKEDASKRPTNGNNDSNYNANNGGFGGADRGQDLYDLKSYTDSLASKT